MNKAVLVLPLLMAMSCSGDDDDVVVNATPLTCEVLAGDNCWREGVTEAGACLPDNAAGTFNVDRSECAFADGTVVVFDQPLPEDLSSWLWDLKVFTPAGAECMSFSNPDDESFILTTSSGTVEEAPWGGLGVGLYCPDGTVYGMENVFDLFECDWADLPGTSASWSGSYVSFSLMGGPEEGGFYFSCDAATM